MPWINHQGEIKQLDDCPVFSPDDWQARQVKQATALRLEFTSFGDGKPFSWCRMLRKSGFTGLLAAAGSIGLDRAFYAFRCGFSLVWLSDEEFGLLDNMHLHPFAAAYQHTEGDSQVFGVQTQDAVPSVAVDPDSNARVFDRQTPGQAHHREHKT